MRPSTGLFDTAVSAWSTPPIRGRATELKMIGALIAAVAQGRGGVSGHRGAARHRKESSCSPRS